MIKLILNSIVSFMLGFIVRGLVKNKKNRKNTKVKPLSKMNKKEFKKAIKDLEIK